MQIKVVLRKKPNKDGSLPLCLRITKDRRTSFIYLGYSVHDKDWDAVSQRVKKSFPNSARLNNYIIKRLSDATNNALELETNNADVTARAVRHKIKPGAGSTFFDQAKEFLDLLKANGKYNQYTSDKPRIKHFRDFIGSDIAFTDITPALLERFKAYLKSTYKPKRGKKQISDRSIINHFVTIRSVYAFARKNKLVTREQSPFSGDDGFKIKFPESVKVGLSAEEVKTIEEADLLDPIHNHARNLWLVSFYFAGMRASDVFRLNWKDVKDGRLHYEMGKNAKVVSLKIPEKAMKILEQYKDNQELRESLIFPELKGCDLDNKFVTQRTIAFKLSAIDKCLRLHVAPAAEIDKKLTMHIARHTFGNISGDKIPIQMLQKLYRHSSIITTMGYQQNFIHKDADEALEAVLSL